jgi:hypothetical protein
MLARCAAAARVVSGVTDGGRVVAVSPGARCAVGDGERSSRWLARSRLAASTQCFACRHWWSVLYPGVAMFALVLGLSFLGERLESWLSGSGAGGRSQS